MLNKKRIFWLLQQLEGVGGTEMVSTQLMNELSNDYDITLLCMGQEPKSIPYEIDPRVKIQYFSFPQCVIRTDVYFANLFHQHHYLKFLKDGIYFIFFWSMRRFSYRRKIKKMTTKDDIIIASSMDNYAISPRGRTVYFHFHFNARFFFSLSNRLGFLFSRKPDRWIFITRSTFEQVCQKKPKLLKCSVQIYNPTRYERNFDTTYKNNHLIFIGRYVAQKRPLLAIEMSKSLRDMGVNFTFSFYGEGPMKEKMEKLVQKYDLGNYVMIHDCHPNIIEEIQKSDLHILTSMFEGFGLVITEANSQCVPTLSLYWGDATYEMIEDGVNGYVVNNDNVDLLAQRVKSLLENPEKLIKMKETTYEHILPFTKQYIIQDWKKLLQ